MRVCVCVGLWAEVALICTDTYRLSASTGYTSELERDGDGATLCEAGKLCVYKVKMDREETLNIKLSIVYTYVYKEHI